MPTPPPLTGIHHLTAISGEIRKNHRFYTTTLGMRLVKRSVNQDDVTAYHLFYADAVGTPGTDLTFFDWKMPPDRRGTHSIVRTHLRVRDESSLDWWERRLREHATTHQSKVETIARVHGRATLPFEDPEGQRLALVVDDGAGDEPTPWSDSPVPPEHQIRGLGPIVLSVPASESTHSILTEVMGMTPSGEYDAAGNPVHVYSMGTGGPHAEIHLAVEADLEPARPGAGGVHHVAFRTPDSESYDAWARRLEDLRIPNSGKVDRYYFESLYFREPNGILFEIATDGPGFDVDESVEDLGKEIALPPFLEPRRAEIVANLRPLG
jgi:glyoxalase family protein